MTDDLDKAIKNIENALADWNEEGAYVWVEQALFHLRELRKEGGA